MSTEVLQFAGELVLDSVIIYSADNSKSLDISLLFSEINIYEDIFSPAMNGSILIAEGYNLISTFPIIGQEIIEIGYHTPTFDSKFFKRFAVTTIEALTIPNANVKNYLLKFVSVEAMIDMTLKISKSYDETPSESAKQIFKKYLPNTELVVSKSTNNIKFIAPLTSPFTTLSMLASKAIDISDYGAPNFLFFENNQKFNFVSLSDLYSQSPIMKYKWSYEPMRAVNNSGESTRDIQAEYENVKQIPEFERLFNTIEKTLHGALGSTVNEVDLIRKTILKRTYGYVTDFSRTKHLNTYPTNDLNLLTNNTSLVNTVITHPYAHDNKSQDKDAFIVSKRPNLLSETEFIKINLVVRGRSDIKVGDVVYFELGDFRSTDQKDLTADGKDPLYTGNYLVGAIMHRITQREHEMQLQIFNDSFSKQINYKS